MVSRQLCRLTSAAAKRLYGLLQPTASSQVVKIGVQRKGCSGLRYQIMLTDLEHCRPDDEIIRTQVPLGNNRGKELTLVVDANAVMFLAGMEIDFVQEPLGSRFIFNNPNAKTTCGCGSSFSS